MIVLSKAQTSEVANFGRQFLSQNRDRHSSFEQAANACVKALYNEFRQENGGHIFALVCIFRLSQFSELPAGIQAKVQRDLGDRWMALMATIGQEPAWCDRRQSEGHQAIVAGENQSPMLKAAFEHLGLKIDENAISRDLVFEEVSLLTHYFHVPEALGSRHVPAQDQFVKPYRIHSVVGLGSPFLTNSAYLALAFAKAPIATEDAQKFAELSPFVSTFLASYEGRGIIWEQSG